MRVVGLISGTSVDGIDAALVEFEGRSADLRLRLLASQTYPYAPEVRSRILAVCGGAALSMAELADLDDAIAAEFSRAAIAIQTDQPPADLIGSHGQTVFHRPPLTAGAANPTAKTDLGYSLQLGRGEAIARTTRQPVVSNLRRADLALGGQGAPLVSRLDAYVLGSDTEARAVQNIGGIGNVTYLPPRQDFADLAAWEGAIAGWDTGPGNVLMDLAVQQFTQGAAAYDAEGARAARGQICAELVDRWLREPFFALPPPKSTGRELFSPEDLARRQAEATALGLGDDDLVATLCDFTAASIAQSYRDFLPGPVDRVVICGGGARNPVLLARLAHHLGQPVQASDELGLDSNAKEAIAFALLAYWRWLGEPGNLPAVTGAARAVPLGELWHP